MITGASAPAILSHVRKVLDHHGRHYDLMTPTETHIGDGPIVLIVPERYDGQALAPHILVIDRVDENEKAHITQLADGLPKAGTVVYNSSDKTVEAICGTKRADVYQEPYKEGAENAARSLLKRIGITEQMFDQAK